MLADTHCHLDQLEDAEAALAEAGSAGVARVVAVSEDLASMRRVLELRSRYPGQVLAGLGLHPMLTPSLPGPTIEENLGFLAANLAAADVLGEVGLDFMHAVTATEQAVQRAVLERQLELAERGRRPVNLHSRRALRPTMELAIEFTRRTGLGAQMHWFTQSAKLVRECNRAGVYVSVGPTVLGSADARAVAAVIDHDLLLLETDSPVPFGGRPARPAWVREVAAVVAEVWGSGFETVAERTTANLERFLGGG